MRIGIDARAFKYSEYKGIANTTFHIIQEWFEWHPEHEYYLISNTEIYLPLSLPDNWHKVRKGRISNGVIWNELELPGIIRRLKLDAFWGPNFLLPPRVTGCRYAVTVHDFGFIYFKGTASAGTSLTLKVLGKKSCRRADKVIAVSGATAKDAEKIYGIREEKISVCRNGTDPIEKIRAIPEKIPASAMKLQDKKFFLFLSTIEPRKNPETVLHAFEKYLDSFGNTDRYLVFAGSKGWNNQSFDEALIQSRHRDRIILTGYVSEEEKQWLLRHAELFVYPSLYEGFGLPILEAMANGTVVITSRVSSMPEVAGNAAFYIDDPQNVNALEKMMGKCCSLPEAQREEIQKRMIRQVNQFSWRTCAEEVLKQLISRKDGE